MSDQQETSKTPEPEATEVHVAYAGPSQGGMYVEGEHYPVGVTKTMQSDVLARLRANQGLADEGHRWHEFSAADIADQAKANEPEADVPANVDPPKATGGGVVNATPLLKRETETDTA